MSSPKRLDFDTKYISIIPFIVAGIVGLIYAQVFSLGYAWDDWHLFINNPSLRLPELAWQGILSPVLPSTAYFRPLALSSFAAEFITLGIQPDISHGINLAIHLGNTLLVGIIAIRVAEQNNLTGMAWRVTIATLFYGLHPALIEPVSWVAGRFDLLVTLFLLLGIWCYLALKGWTRDFAVMACFLCAFLSKEMAVTFPLIIALFYIGQHGPGTSWKDILIGFNRDREWRIFLLLTFAGILVLGMRYALMGQLLHRDTTIAAGLDNVFDHLAFIGQSLIFYLKMSLWPFADINPQHPLNLRELDLFGRWIGVLATGGGVLAVCLLIYSRRWVGLLLAGWLISLLPVLNIMPLTIRGNIGQERFLTFPLVLLALAFATLIFPKCSLAMRRLMPILIGGFASLFIIASVANIRVTVPLWSNDLTLWTWVYTRYSSLSFVQVGYADAAIRHRKFQEADALFNAVGDNMSHELKVTKGLYLARTDRHAEAVEVYEKVLNEVILPHQLLVEHNLDLEKVKLNKTGVQIRFLQSAYTGLAEAQLELGNYAEAEKNSKIALFYSPYYAYANLIRSFAYYGLGDWEEGEVYYKNAVNYFTPEWKILAVEMRSRLMNKLCISEVVADEVCKHWQDEKGAF